MQRYYIEGYNTWNCERFVENCILGPTHCNGTNDVYNAVRQVCGFAVKGVVLDANMEMGEEEAVFKISIVAPMEEPSRATIRFKIDDRTKFERAEKLLKLAKMTYDLHVDYLK